MFKNLIYYNLHTWTATAVDFTKRYFSVAALQLTPFYSSFLSHRKYEDFVAIGFSNIV